MTWWWVPLILGVIIGGILTGLKVSRILLGKQERTPLFSFNHVSLEEERKQSTSIEIAEDSQKTPSEEQRLPAIRIFKNDALKELEYNLAIADKPLNGKLSIFQTAVWDNRRSEFDGIDPDIKIQLIQAYTDMLLANSLVQMSNDVGGDNRSLSLSYLNLKTKVAERLQRILPHVKTTLED